MTARLFITVFRDMARDSNNQLVGAPMAPPLAEMTLDITHESIASAPFPAYSRFISIKAEADCCVAFGIDPIADSQYHLIEAGERIFYGVHEGHQIAAIDYTIRDLIDGHDDDGREEKEFDGSDTGSSEAQGSN